MYSEHIGDIFTSTADAIGHGVNCHGLMAAGIAKAVRAKMPDRFYADYNTLCQLYDMQGEFNISVNDETGLTIVNLYTQVFPGPNAEYRLLVSSMARFIMENDSVLNDQDNYFESIALPRIGCGIGGLDWNIVKPILQGFSKFIDIEVWELPEVADEDFGTS